MKKIVAFALLGVLCLLTAAAHATDYTFRGGYYWNGSRAYTRQKVHYPQTYSYRQVYTPGAYGYAGSYSYQQVADPAYYYYEYTEVTPPAQKAAYTDPGWRVKLLELARERDKYEGNLRKADLEQRAYIESLNALGMTGNFRWNNYGNYAYSQLGAPALAPAYEHNIIRQDYRVGSYGIQGNTTYGYSVNQLRNLYGDTDLNGLYQQAARLTQNAQSLSGQANGDFQGLVQQAGDNAGRVAEILARAQAASAALAATNPQSRAESRSTTTTIRSTAAAGGGVDPPAALPMDRVGAQEFMRTVATPRCAACHTGEKAKAGFDVAAYPGMSVEQKRVVWARLLTENKEKRMPLAPDGSPGTPLTAAELQLFLQN